MQVRTLDAEKLTASGVDAFEEELGGMAEYHQKH